MINSLNFVSSIRMAISHHWGEKKADVIHKKTTARDGQRIQIKKVHNKGKENGAVDNLGVVWKAN